MKDKRLILIALLTLLFVLQNLSVYGPITMAVVIYESEVGKTEQKYVEVMNGKTSQQLRAINKWRQYDRDAVPEDIKNYKKIISVLDECNGNEVIPSLFILHGSRITWNGWLPERDTDLSSVIQRQGGI
jgi:hypothetical protein